MNISVSVILPTFNEADNLKLIIPKISEILNQEGINFEIIVVDDNSPDGTADIAMMLSRNYPVSGLFSVVSSARGRGY